MKAKFFTVLIMWMTAGGFLANAQVDDEMGEFDRADRLNAQKVAFFTNRMQLTSEESEEFWPVYNEYQKKRSLIQEERRSANAYYIKNQALMTDKELEEIADKLIGFQEQEAALAREYHEKFKQVLPIQKVIRLYQTENLYKAFLLRQLRDRAPGMKDRPVRR